MTTFEHADTQVPVSARTRLIEGASSTAGYLGCLLLVGAGVLMVGAAGIVVADAVRGWWR